MLLAKLRKTLRPPVSPLVPAGSALVFDYRTLHRGRAVADAMREAEELGNQFRHSPQWQQDLSRDQVNKRRHALKELVRTNRDPRQNVDDYFQGVSSKKVPREQMAAAQMRGTDPTLYAPTRAQAPQRMDGQRSVPSTRKRPDTAPAGSSRRRRGRASAASA